MKKINRLIFPLLCLLLLATPSFGQTVDTIEVFSPKMQRSIKNVIVLPESYKTSKDKKYPVLYLLHGYSGRYDYMLKRVNADFPKTSSHLEMIVVCPNGENSWYWDSPTDPKSQFETYVSKELVEYIDSNYRTIAAREGRAVTGLSMGGHGGLWLGIHHPEVFGGCGSMSGGVDIRPFPEKWEMKKQLGEYSENRGRWSEYTVIDNVDKIKTDSIPRSIIIDCGVSDFFYEVNENLHRKLLSYKIPHDYITRPGSHNGPYWRTALEFQLLYFSRFFNDTVGK